MMLPLSLLIKFILLLIIFQISFSINLLVANWRLSPEFWSPNFFLLAMATKMVAAWSTEILHLLTFHYWQYAECLSHELSLTALAVKFL